MDSRDIIVLKYILDVLHESEFVRECKIARKADQQTAFILESLIESDQKFSIFRFTAKNGFVCILRLDDAGSPAFAASSEKLLKRIPLQTLLYGPKTKPSKRMGFALDNDLFVIMTRMQFVARPNDPPPLAEKRPGGRIAIASRRTEIEEWLYMPNSPIALIYGSPGCGKRTQVVQYILEECNRRSEYCHALCVFQEDVQLLTAVEQIANERKENVGGTVGYKAFGNFRVSNVTKIVFCTEEDLLLSFKSARRDQAFAELTHVIVNDVGRRKASTDFLLSLLAEKVQFHPGLKLVLLTESKDVMDFVRFFRNPRLIAVPDATEPSGVGGCGVQPTFLDTILTEVKSYHYIEYLKHHLLAGEAPLQVMANLQEKYGYRNIDHFLMQQLDELLNRCWHATEASELLKLYTGLKTRRHLVDYQHSQTRLTLLMIAAAKGYVNVVQKLLDCGANPLVRDKNGLTAFNLCCGTAQHSACRQLLESFCRDRQYCDPSMRAQLICQQYYKMHNPTLVNTRLLCDIVLHIATKLADTGKILVTLRHYSEMLKCYTLLRENEIIKARQIQFLLYHQFLAEDELTVKGNFCWSPNLMVILVAGPLLELVPSLDCIDYVIDTGLRVRRLYNVAKQAYYDQRCVTAKRTAIFLQRLARKECFFMYPREQFEQMPLDEQPDRNGSALPRQVLLALIARSKSFPSVQTFYASALTPAPARNVSQSLERLFQIGAIERTLSQPTDLGLLLASLRIELHLGKALLYSILFKCLDPMLTIVASLMVGNRFRVLHNEQLQKQTVDAKVALSRSSFSDCLVLLRLYQQWSVCKINQRSGMKLDRYRLNVGAMEAISNVRGNIIASLRSLCIVNLGRLKDTNDLNQYANSWTRVKAALTAGFYPNLAKVDYATKTFRGKEDPTMPLVPHPHSVVALAEMPAQWVIYEHREDPLLGLLDEYETFVPTVHIVENTVVSDWMVMLMCHLDENGHPAAVEADEARGEPPKYVGLCTHECAIEGRCTNVGELIIDQRYTFRLSANCYHRTVWMRKQIGRLFRQFVQCPLHTVRVDPKDEYILEQVFELLDEEEKSIFVDDPIGVGLPPKIRSHCTMGKLFDSPIVVKQDLIVVQTNQTCSKRGWDNGNDSRNGHP